jgi:hypothetical protein
MKAVMSHVKKLWPLPTATHRDDQSISTHGRGQGRVIDARVQTFPARHE